MICFARLILIKRYEINVREYQAGNPKRKIQRNCQHIEHKTNDEDKQTKNTTREIHGLYTCTVYLDYIHCTIYIEPFIWTMSFSTLKFVLKINNR